MYEEQRLLADTITKLRFSDQPDEAIALCHQGMSQFPTNSFFPKLQGDICRQYERYPQAAQAYLKMLGLLRPDQFSIFATAYRNLEKSAPTEVMYSFLNDIRELLNNKCLAKELDKNLHIFLGSQLAIDDNFLVFFKQANDDNNINFIRKEIEKWETSQDTSKIEALATLKLNTEETANSRKIDAFLIQR